MNKCRTFAAATLTLSLTLSQAYARPADLNTESGVYIQPYDAPVGSDVEEVVMKSPGPIGPTMNPPALPLIPKPPITEVVTATPPAPPPSGGGANLGPTELGESCQIVNGKCATVVQIETAPTYTPKSFPTDPVVSDGSEEIAMQPATGFTPVPTYTNPYTSPTSSTPPSWAMPTPTPSGTNTAQFPTPVPSSQTTTGSSTTTWTEYPTTGYATPTEGGSRTGSSGGSTAIPLPSPSSTGSGSGGSGGVPVVANDDASTGPMLGVSTTAVTTSTGLFPLPANPRTTTGSTSTTGLPGTSTLMTHMTDVTEGGASRISLLRTLEFKPNSSIALVASYTGSTKTSVTGAPPTGGGGSPSCVTDSDCGGGSSMDCSCSNVVDLTCASGNYRSCSLCTFSPRCAGGFCELGTPTVSGGGSSGCY